MGYIQNVTNWSCMWSTYTSRKSSAELHETLLIYSKGQTKDKQMCISSINVYLTSWAEINIVTTKKSSNPKYCIENSKKKNGGRAKSED